jgi:hypothetical protein
MQAGLRDRVGERERGIEAMSIIWRSISVRGATVHEVAKEMD